MDDEDAQSDFLGEYDHSMDAKGRLVLPASFREKLQGGLVMTVGFEGCLTVVTDRQWAKTRETLQNLKTTDERHRRFVRAVTSKAVKMELDGQGRITIPPAHRAYANLQKDVKVIGALTRAEIWDRATWGTYDMALGDIAEMSADLDVSIF